MSRRIYEWREERKKERGKEREKDIYYKVGGEKASRATGRYIVELVVTLRYTQLSSCVIRLAIRLSRMYSVYVCVCVCVFVCVCVSAVAAQEGLEMTVAEHMQARVCVHEARARTRFARSWLISRLTRRVSRKK